MACFTFQSAWSLLGALEMLIFNIIRTTICFIFLDLIQQEWTRIFKIRIRKLNWSVFKLFQSFCDLNWHISVQTVRDDVLDCHVADHAVGDQLSGGQFHLVCDTGQIMQMDASEDAGEDQRVVDLVLEITSSTSIDESSRFVGFVGQDFRVWVSHGENYAIFVHRLHPFLLQCPSDRNSNKYISPFDHFFQVPWDLAFVGHLWHFSFLSIHSFFSAFVNCTLRIADDDVLDSVVQKKVGDCDTCGSSSIDNNFHILDGCIPQLGSIDESGKGDDCCSVLVVVENWDDVLFGQSSFDLEALRCSNIFQIYGLEVWSQI